MIKMLDDIIDFYFVTSPCAYVPQEDALVATLAAYESVPEYPNQRVWWIS